MDDWKLVHNIDLHLFKVSVSSNDLGKVDEFSKGVLNRSIGNTNEKASKFRGGLFRKLIKINSTINSFTYYSMMMYIHEAEYYCNSMVLIGF